MASVLRVEQLHAIGEMQHSLLLAARMLRRVNRLALAHNIELPAGGGLNIAELRAVSERLAGLVVQHMRDVPDERRATLARYAAPMAVPQS